LPIEVELKLAFAPATAADTVIRLLRHPALAATKRGRARTAKVASTYFDTPDFRLAEAGVALRLRNDGGHWLQTVKGPPLKSAGGALHARCEYEWPVPRKRIDSARLATTPFRKQFDSAIASAELRPRFTTNFERKTIPLEFADGTQAKLCIDVGAIRATRVPRSDTRRTRQCAIAEIEIELVEGDATHLFALAEAVAADLPLTVATASKAERGHSLAAGWPDGWRTPVRAKHVTVASDSSTADALRTIAVECLHQIAANATGLVNDRDPEWVHQMRIGTRRLRACLTLSAKLMPPESLYRLLTELEWLAKTLGAARDWDVFATETMHSLVVDRARDAPAVSDLRRLRSRIATRRGAARAAVRDAVCSRRFQQLMLGVGALCAAPRLPAPVPADSETDRLAAPAKLFAQQLLRRRHRKLMGRLPDLGDGTEEERHAVRIAAKKLRYAAEFFVSLFPRKRARTYLKTLARLQDVLGQFNDGTIAARLASSLERPGHEAAVGIVRGWVAAQAAAREPKLARVQRRFEEAKPFWT
jgi:inorganic triphosphatase YgiF